MIYIQQFFIIIFICFLGLACARERPTQSEFSLKERKVFGKPGVTDRTEIEWILRLLAESIIDENLEPVLIHINEEEGIWVDLKAHWTKKQFREEWNEKNGYFQTYFFSTELLRKQKSNTTSLSVKDILLKSEGFSLDFYFESKEECEVDIIFNSSSPLEGDLSNPVFRKIGNRWYLYRLL
ncbi:hypothetical protein [Leptospira sp. GIMC2001]|uniref:hypothetical protein n=1 Tax=Leptospira sp. GIMC2001 TaxID=1513297 RepID=UPI00234AD3B6|nr:hypothetical protein [Leptospira sp. GIMC2001]WCL48097.1 hypothetical protein O4O04_12310 [Leptospira sp. GIMC2001]